jgi:hypothetical protein
MTRLNRIAAIWLLALSSPLSALSAERTYDAECQAQPQIDSITVAGTWAEDDTGSVTIGNSTLVVTAASDTTTTAQIADAIRRAINANTIDENRVGSESRSAAGQKLAEFRDVEAAISASDSSVVLVRSKTPGVPFFAVGGSTLSVADTASGSLTAASVQAAQGPWHWNIAKNWSSDTAPVDDDTVVFRDTTNGPQYGLPNGSLEVTPTFFSTFTGQVGLPLLNTANGQTYTEYRQRYVRTDDAGGGSAIAAVFGLGPGPGSPLINWKFSTLPLNAVVYNTGQPRIANTKALNLCATSNTSTLRILNGSVDCSSQDGGTSAWATLEVSGASDVMAYLAMKAAGAVTVSAGNLVLGGTTALASVTLYGGNVTLHNQTGTISAMTVQRGAVRYNSTATITQLTVDAGEFDASQETRAFTVTDADVYKASRYRDPNSRATVTTFQLHCDCTEAALELGGSNTNTITIAY